MLAVRNLHVAYGKIRAVQGVDLDIFEGEIVTLIGANGAGKSTILRAISGIERFQDGTILFRDRDIGGCAPHDIIEAGLIQVPEGRQIFSMLTVRENLRIATRGRKDREWERQAGELLSIFPHLDDLMDQPASVLSGGQAQMLALARGLVARPRVLMLDEPTLGLAPKTAREIFGIIQTLRDGGLTVLVVEQNLNQALELADRAYVIESGRVEVQGPAKDLRGDAHLRRAYLGFLRKEPT